MGFFLCHIAVFSATLLFLVQSQPSSFSRHNEIHRARSQIDSLIYKLTLDLNNFKRLQSLARNAREEIAVLKPVQRVLEKLAKGNTPSGYLCSTTRSGEINVRIEAKGSQLPKHYTITIPGKKNNDVLCNQIFSFLEETKKHAGRVTVAYLFGRTIIISWKRQSFRSNNKTKLVFAFKKCVWRFCWKREFEIFKLKISAKKTKRRQSKTK